MAFKSHSLTFEDQLGAVIGVLIGSSLMGVGLWAQGLEAHQREHWVETSGQIVDSVRYYDRQENETTYAPVIQFEINGDPARFTGSYQRYRLSEGKQVVVRYDPNDPVETARIVDSFDGIAPWAGFGLGAASLIAGLGRLLPFRWS
ncbi:DUF3592 domain-containing protein [Lyngbya confervoides]|uniref:DUF3592 domain-containing protein n=1 Tax=Lyngbya confervoides BDU141951 TaxID=1574623 RepID=A0ABD4T5R5_9CYAN|nr:DUF3592 domain-containing protein [Lyngbya confervoides]MCM1984009.1 DUF3592 domain-containing protein [Lyngbya confervoides BDU141951]